MGELKARGASSAPASPAGLVDAIWARIEAAKRPMLRLRVELQRYGMQDQAQALVEASGLPFTTSSLGETALDVRQPAFIGTYADAASPAGTLAVADAPGCVVTLGVIVTDDDIPIMKDRYKQSNLTGLPRDTFAAQAAWGSLGHEAGCALGVELATGRRPIVAAGDGGFMMIAQEVTSLVRQGSSAVIFVMSNGGYAIEQSFVDLCAFTPSGSYARFDLLPRWDYPALAEAFGARGCAVQTVGQLRRLLSRLEVRDGVPSLVQVQVPIKDLPPQMRALAEEAGPPSCGEGPATS